MHQLPEIYARLRRFRGALLAGGIALALAGSVAVTGIVAPSPGSAQNDNGDAVTAQTAQAQTTSRTPFDFADLAEEVRGAVVSVQVEGAGPDIARGPGGGGGMPEFFENLPEDHPMRRFFREFGMPFDDENGQEGRPERRGGMPSVSQGSGFFISEDGYLVTNNHVVSRGDDIRVVLDDGTEYTAEIVGIDDQTDLALLRVDPQDGETFEYVSFSDRESRVGEWVVAVGNPFGLGGTVTAGIISASGREIGAGPYDDFIQIDASVNRGNSGGPAFNLDGEVVGVNTAIFSPSGGNVGIAFAIPAHVATPVINQLRETGVVERGWLGVQIQPVTDDIAQSLGLDEARGAIVADLMDTGPAGDAGIRPGDVILSVDGEPVNDARDLARRIGNLPPGAEARIELWRDDQVQDMTLTLGQRPSDARQAAVEPDVEPEAAPEPQIDEELRERLGLALAPGDMVGSDRGVAIMEADPDGEGARKGLQTGDVILEVAGQEVNTPDEVRVAVRQAEERGRAAVLMRVQSDQGQRFVALSLGDTG